MEKTPEGDVMDELGLNKYCCRRHMLTHVNIEQKLIKINYKLIKKNPKVLIGYSDITALLQAIYLQTGLIGFHGPVGASDMTDYTQAQLLPLIVDFQNSLLHY